MTCRTLLTLIILLLLIGCIQNVNEQGWKIIAFTRINPIFPTGPLNYFYGLTSISYGRYIIATVMFLLPLTVVFAYVGDSIGDFMLNDEANDIVQHFMSLSAVFVILVVMHIAIKYWVNPNHNTKVKE